MRLGCVIGKVILNLACDSLAGSRLLVVSPLKKDQLKLISDARTCVMSQEQTIIVYDNLGAGVGDIIGFVEGREAAVPFKADTPVDAYNAAIIDTISYK